MSALKKPAGAATKAAFATKTVAKEVAAVKKTAVKKTAPAQ